MDHYESLDRLLEIKEEIKELLDEAIGLVRDHAPGAASRAEAYWYPHILCALDKDHGYMGGSMYTLQSAIDEMDEDGENEEKSDE
jgi:hypothetical protein